MTFRRLTVGVAAGAAAMAALALTAAPANAAVTAVAIKAGTAASGTALTLTGTTTGTSPQVKFTDLTTNTKLQCTSATASGAAKVGTGQSPSKVAQIKSSKWNTCTGPLGLKFAVTQNGTWYLNATGATASGKTAGTISSVSATVDGGSSCKFSVTGTAPGSYTNGTSAGTLAVSTPATAATATLTIGTVTGGCFGLVKTGDKAQFVATYSIKAQSPYNPVTVTAT